MVKLLKIHKWNRNYYKDYLKFLIAVDIGKWFLWMQHYSAIFRGKYCVMLLQCTKYKLGLMISSIGNLAARHDQNSKLSVILDW